MSRGRIPLEYHIDKNDEVLVMEKKEIGIGILGLGQVGGGVLQILDQHRAFIEQEISPHKIKVIGIADLDAGRKPEPNRDNPFFTTSAQEVIGHSDIQIMVEAIGGEHPAYELIKKALQNGKHVVTPNKEVVAKHGYELLAIAHQNKVQFLFEASVGSAIPILGVILNMLTSGPVEEISGILNGTTNYILDLMWEDNMTQQEALSIAQEKGYAEADPSKDIMGLDALYKIFILASLGFRARINLNQISYSGINEITLEDVQLVKQLAYRVKLLATARRKGSKVDIRINPVLIEDGQLLAHIHGADNGIFLSGYGYGNLFFSGAGAGGIAGASMIISDIIRIIRQPHYFEYGFLLKDSEELKIQRFDQLGNQYFLKVKLENGEKNKENIQNIFSKNNLFIKKTAEIKSEDEDNSLTMGIITDLGEESRFKRIYSEIKELSYTRTINYLEVYRNAKNKSF